LLNRASRKEIEERARLIEKIETAVDPNFQQHFVAAMGIPRTAATSSRKRRRSEFIRERKSNSNRKRKRDFNRE